MKHLPFLALVLLVACRAQKPTFELPKLVLDAPVAQSSSAVSSLARSSVASSLSSIIATSSSSSSALPPSVLINVPFAPQAPFAVWDPLHEEACEEMSLIMVHHFLAKEPLSLADAERDLQDLIAWEREHGYGDDVSAAQIGEIAASYYADQGYRFRLLEDVTADDLRRELAAGRPVIIPAAGQLLGNPFFSGEGPPYHMLVVIGYTDDGFITNDPGTKRGAQYWYPTDRLLSAIHDWTGEKEGIMKGARVGVVLEQSTKHLQ